MRVEQSHGSAGPDRSDVKAVHWLSGESWPSNSLNSVLNETGLRSRRGALQEHYSPASLKAGRLTVFLTLKDGLLVKRVPSRCQERPYGSTHRSVITRS